MRAIRAAKEWRTVEPYIVGIKDKGKGNAFLAALPINELAKPVSDRNTGHYLLSKLDMNRFEILPDIYDKPHLARERITNTPTIEVICRYMYED